MVVKPREVLFGLAEKSDSQLLLVPPGSFPAEVQVPETVNVAYGSLDEAAEAMGLALERIGEVIVVGSRNLDPFLRHQGVRMEPGAGMPFPPPPFQALSGPPAFGASTLDWTEDRGLIRALAGASSLLGKALMASLGQAQIDALVNERRAEDVARVYDLVYVQRPPAQRPRPAFLTIGGSLTGDRLTDFQRRLCAATMYAGGGSGCWDWEWLRTADSASILDVVVECLRKTEWHPELVITNEAKYRRMGRWRYRGGMCLLDLEATLPTQPVAGADLEKLVEWAKASTVPRDPWKEYVGFPPCEWRTNGPTSDVTSIITNDEARLSLAMPTDIRPSTQEVVEAFGKLGIRIEGWRDVGAGWGPEDAPPQGEPPILTLLTLLDALREKNQYFVREGNTIRLVYDWEVSGEYCLDPGQYLPTGVAEKPITLTSFSASIEEVLKAIREQSGAQVFPGRAAQESPVRLTVRVKDAPALALLRGMTKYLEGGWEVREDGSLVLIPRSNLQPDRYALPPFLAKEERRPERALGMALSVLVESLTEEQKGKAAEGFLAADDLKSVAQNLLVATAAIAFKNPSPVTQWVYLSNLRALPDGTWEARVWIGNSSEVVTSLEVPTIPPNKPRGSLVFEFLGPPPPQPPE